MTPFRPKTGSNFCWVGDKLFYFPNGDTQNEKSADLRQLIVAGQIALFGDNEPISDLVSNADEYMNELTEDRARAEKLLQKVERLRKKTFAR